jgi:hypothetical protein
MLLMVFIAKGIKLSLADVKINTLQCAQRTSCGTHQGHGVSGHRCKEIVVQDVTVLRLLELVESLELQPSI